MRQINQVPDASSAGFYNPCSGALSIVMPQEAINQIQNPSFELYLDTNNVAFPDWRVTRISTPGGVTSTLTNISPYITTTGREWSGANSLYTANVAGFNFISLQYVNLSITTNLTYAFSFYLFGETGSHNRIYTITVAVGATTVATRSVQVVEGRWQRFELVFRSTLTSAVATATITKDPVGGSYAGGDVYIDALQFEQITIADTMLNIPVSSMHATTYFDGDTTGLIDDSTGIIEFAWEGLPHRSRSVRSEATAAGGRIYNLQDDFDLEIIGIAEASMAQPQVQTLTYNSQDGGTLQDIINPVRTITLIGQLHGLDKIDLARKVQRLTALFSRDLVQFRQDRTFIFQHLDGREPIGVPMTFTGTFTGGLNVMATDLLSVNIDISIQMHDPYFYGHDEGMSLLPPSGSYGTGLYKVSTYQVSSITSMMQSLGPVGTNLANVYTLAQAQDGRIWIGGDFLLPHPYITIYNPATNTFSAVPGATLNAAVNSIKFAPDGKAWIGGNFTGAIGNYLTTHNGTAYTSTGNFNNFVYGIQIVPAGISYEVYAVGAFTTAPSGAANRIARYTTAWSSYGTGTGFNNIVYAITYNSISDILYVGGAFTTTQGGAVACPRVAQITRSGGSTSACGAGIPNNSVRSLYIDTDQSLIIGGDFTSPTNYLAYFANGVITAWSVGYTTPITSIGINQITRYRDGIFVGSPRSISSTVIAVPAYKTALPSVAYWNGSAISGSAWIPIADCSISTFTGLELPNGDFIISIIGGSPSSIQLSHTLNSSTVQAYPKIRLKLNNGSQYQVVGIINARDTKMMLFNDRFEQNGVSASIDYDFVAGQVITIVPKNGTLTAYVNENLLYTLNPAGSFVDFVLRPGIASIGACIGDNSIMPTIEVYWPQTFQSIFDGVYKQ